MNKILGIIFAFLLAVTFNACDISLDFNEQEETAEHKQFTPYETQEYNEERENMGEIKAEENFDESMDSEQENIEIQTYNNVTSITKNDVNVSTHESNTENDSDFEREEVRKYTGANYITLNTPSKYETFYSEPIIFKGVVSPNTEKIVITASAEREPVKDSVIDQSYKETYTLQDFKKGDTFFTYRAKMDFYNLTYGSNDYEFTAYFDDGTKKSAYLTVYYMGDTV